jgi:hypothetical protein
MTVSIVPGPPWMTIMTAGVRKRETSSCWVVKYGHIRAEHDQTFSKAPRNLFSPPKFMWTPDSTKIKWECAGLRSSDPLALYRTVWALSMRLYRMSRPKSNETPDREQRLVSWDRLKAHCWVRQVDKHGHNTDLFRSTAGWMRFLTTK